MGFILSILSVILFIIVSFLNFFFTLIYDVKNKKWFKNKSKSTLTSARNIDIFSNFNFNNFWNFTLSNGGYSFGRLGETISSCLGKKLEEKSLNVVGLILAYTINIIDISTWLSGGHCNASKQTEQEIKNFYEKEM